MSLVAISRTGYSTGWDSDPYKFVYGLTADERAAVDKGSIVVITNCPPAGGNHGTRYRIVVPANGRYGHRVPTAEQLHEIDAVERGGLADDPRASSSE